MAWAALTVVTAYFVLIEIVAVRMFRPLRVIAVRTTRLAEGDLDSPFPYGALGRDFRGRRGF